ncbi:MAG: dTDP-glucose 4,6-dehydratase [Simkaniaceae bacterium]|nr:dTDP-glucose 4,6-dehydratase [Simkaniaceae bacterium]MCF7852404.1 dTDP-glucose 4,6-dehydratase [Simkaniaceae bacterium]
MLNKLKQSTLLVTGGAGFMGSSFIRRLLNQGDFQGRIINLDLLTYAGNLDNLSGYDFDERYQFYQGDVQDSRLLRRLDDEYQIDIIIHFAAQTHVDKSIQSPRTFLETNILGTQSLLELVRERPRIQFHLVSTDEVYGSLGDEGQFNEDSPYRPRSPYSASKAAADHLAFAYHETYEMFVTISHASNNYGPCQYPEKFIPLMILNCMERKPLPLYGNGRNVRDWMFVDDHSKALICVLEKGVNGHVYNLASNEEIANIDLLHLLIDQFANITETDPQIYKNLITFVSDRPGHDFRYSLNTDKMKKELGCVATHSLEEGMGKTIRWYLNNLDWVERVKSKTYFDWVNQQYKTIAVRYE